MQAPVAEDEPVWTAPDAAWLEKYKDEMSTEESATAAIDADGNRIYTRQVTFKNYCFVPQKYDMLL